MNVKELITELLDYDLDAEVEIGIRSPLEDDDFDFELEENGKYLELTVSLRDKSYVMLDNRDFDDMEKEISGLKARIEELEEEQND